MKKLIVFDLDGTLAESKSSLDAEMAALLNTLLGLAQVAVISGGNWPQFEKQVLSNLAHDEHLKNLSLLPTCGTKFYRYESDWKLLYAEDFTAEEKKKIIASLRQVMELPDFKVEKRWGELLEDRGSQITFSALGQQAPVDEKKKWDPDFAKRQRMKTMLDQAIPEFSVRLGGMTSVDVTKPGIDKAYGIRKLRDILGIAIAEMIFIGDALFPGGNDYPAKEAGAPSIQVKDPHETKRVVEAIIACMADLPEPNFLNKRNDEPPLPLHKDPPNRIGDNMQNDQRNEYVTRERILKLLSDGEAASVSNAETAVRLADGDEYLDLEQISQGVRRASAGTPPGNLLPKKSVHQNTWDKILAHLGEPHAKRTRPM